MDLFEAILSAEVLAGVLTIGAFAMAIRSILHFTREAAELRPRLAELDRELRKRREASEEVRKQVATLVAEIAPIRAREIAVRSYQEELTGVVLEHERRQHEQSSDDEASRRKRIQRKKMGFGNE